MRSLWCTAEGRRTLSRILWKSKTLSPGNLQASHSRYHFFSLTGFPKRLKYLSPLISLKGSRSPSSEILLFVRMRVVRFGADRCKEGEMVDIRLLARRRVCSRLRRGRLLSETRELSVKSMASCWSYIRMMGSPICEASEIMYATLVTPRFSIAGILYPGTAVSIGRQNEFSADLPRRSS
jgi:hypothetical protein